MVSGFAELFDETRMGSWASIRVGQELARGKRDQRQGAAQAIGISRNGCSRRAERQAADAEIAIEFRHRQLGEHAPLRFVRTDGAEVERGPRLRRLLHHVRCPVSPLQQWP